MAVKLVRALYEKQLSTGTYVRVQEPGCALPGGNRAALFCSTWLYMAIFRSETAMAYFCVSLYGDVHFTPV